MSSPLPRSACPAVLLALLSLLHANAADNAPGPAQSIVQAPACVQRDDEVWLISSRHLCYQCGTDPASYELDVRRHDKSLGWQDSTPAEFFESNTLPTTIYVHGNRIEWCESFQHGWEVYQSLAQCCPNPSKMRFVIWTWESDQIRGPLRDIRLKADRADSEIFLLGGFLSKLNPATPVNLIGYSYGARIITGGLHLLAGGSLGGIILPQATVSERAPIRTALLAPAMDHDWLCPGYCHGSALEPAERLLVLYNTCDPALQRYHLIDKCSRATALGYVGLPYNCLGAYASRAEEVDVCCYVGRSHDESRYFGSSEVMHHICRVLYSAE